MSVPFNQAILYLLTPAHGGGTAQFLSIVRLLSNTHSRRGRVTLGGFLYLVLGFLYLVLSTTLLSAAGLKIDHVTVAGTDVRHLQAALKSAGIDSVYGGPHSNHASEMALTS